MNPVLKLFTNGKDQQHQPSRNTWEHHAEDKARHVSAKPETLERRCRDPR